MNCHICEQRTTAFTHEKTETTYYHCNACEFIFKSPECYQDFEAQKERYNLHENNDEDAGYIAYFKRFLDFTLPLLSKPKSALDFGCGRTSLLASLLDKEGITCDYYDPIYYPNTLVEGKKYDLIVSTEVFEHLHKPSFVFENLLEKLHTGGYLSLQTEFHGNDLESFQKWWYPSDTTHVVFFRPKTFKVLCEMYGCRFVKDNGKNMLLMQKV